MNLSQIQSHSYFTRYKGVPVPALMLALFSLAVLADCSLFQKKKEGRFSYELDCDNNQAILTIIENEAGLPKEKGPVQLEADMTCDQAEDLDEKGLKKLKRHGTWDLYWSDSKSVMSRGEFVNGAREGQFTYFFKDSDKTMRTVQYRKGKKEGPEISYFEDGSTKEEGQNAEGFKSDTWKQYNAPNANCITTGAYHRDLKEGLWEECSLDGESKTWYVARKITYQKGLKHGQAQSFNKDGRKTAEGTWKGDFSDECKKDPKAVFRNIFPNCRPPEGVWPAACSRRNGPWRFYNDKTINNQDQLNQDDPDKKKQPAEESPATTTVTTIDPDTGEQVTETVNADPKEDEFGRFEEGNYRENKRDGVWKEYYASGELRATGTRVADKCGFRDGPWDIFLKDKTRIGTFTYNNEHIFKYAVLYKDGQKVSEGELSMGLIKYDPEKDALVLPPTMKEGGVWKFYENGRLTKEGGMMMGKMHGQWKFMQNGRLESEGEMVMGRNHGKWKYYTNGQLVREGEYMQGKKHGQWRELKGGRWVETCYMIGKERPCR
ncbi:MAG: hypothetical protein KDK39_12745 [Leptospiraceae bacterium]|nr:hypothetical protein [Leptospiraceae bacterium]